MNNRGGEGARLGLPDIDDGFLFRLCEAAAENGGMVCPHPETIEIAWVLRDRLKASDPEGHGGLKTWNATRPPFVEADAVQRAAYIAHTAGAPLYVVHTSSAEALEAALRHRRAGASVHIETCPHYLTHDVGWSGRRYRQDQSAAARSVRPRTALAGACATAKSIRSRPITFIAISPPRPAASGRRRLAAQGLRRCFLFCSAKGTINADCRSNGSSQSLRPIRPGSWVSATPRAASRPDSMPIWRLSISMPNGPCSAATWCRARAIRSMKGQRFKGRVRHAFVRGRAVLRDDALVDAAVGHGRYIRRRLPS